MSRNIDTDLALLWPAPPEKLTLKNDEVHVWAVALDQPQALLLKLNAVVSAEESARGRRFHFERDQTRFIVGRGSLRALLGKYLEISPAHVQFQFSARGKPWLASTHVRGQVHFNLAHSGGLALVAITHVTDVGVDVEQVRPVQDAESIARRFFSRRESAVLGGLAPMEMQAVFFNLWTRKEAWLKATGEGIGGSLNQVEVSCLPEEPARVVSLFGSADTANEWRLLHLTPANGYVGALAIHAAQVQLNCWRFDPIQSDFPH